MNSSTYDLTWTVGVGADLKLHIKILSLRRTKKNIVLFHVHDYSKLNLPIMNNGVK